MKSLMKPASGTFPEAGDKTRRVISFVT